MVEILLIPTEDLLSDESYFSLEDSAGDKLERDSTELEIGSYCVVARGRFPYNHPSYCQITKL